MEINHNDKQHAVHMLASTFGNNEANGVGGYSQGGESTSAAPSSTILPGCYTLTIAAGFALATIFVRVYEERMDQLFRAAIIGTPGTPNHDGLFFFDILFPSAYPDVPPCIYGLYHVCGLDAPALSERIRSFSVCEESYYIRKYLGYNVIGIILYPETVMGGFIVMASRGFVRKVPVRKEKKDVLVQTIEVSYSVHGEMGNRDQGPGKSLDVEGCGLEPSTLAKKPQELMIFEAPRGSVETKLRLISLKRIPHAANFVFVKANPRKAAPLGSHTLQRPVFN
ncbi:hypothetical protein IFM89_004081 [Coptis chinensis]|uniref:Uncharacterized protein n=1 Tax=Coptis chinensis TaxID=261450 RepID=A0A835H2J4_9MAGN|nr:hypothetical protein IFM89_004081 [Coptis chinensis]